MNAGAGKKKSGIPFRQLQRRGIALLQILLGYGENALLGIEQGRIRAGTFQVAYRFGNAGKPAFMSGPTLAGHVGVRIENHAISLNKPAIRRAF